MINRVRVTIGNGKRVLEHYEGAGDVVGAVIKTVTRREPCRGCIKVENILNTALPNPFYQGKNDADSKKP